MSNVLAGNILLAGKWGFFLNICIGNMRCTGNRRCRCQMFWREIYASMVSVKNPPHLFFLK